MRYFERASKNKEAVYIRKQVQSATSNMKNEHADSRFGVNHDELVVPGFELPPSPPSSYDNLYPPDNVKLGPPLLPYQLPQTLLDNPTAGNYSETETLPQPPLPTVNHLYLDKGNPSQPLLALRATHRFREKFVTVVYYRTLPQLASTRRA
ncbi:unnamed protein product [Rhodiola kirilowii]